MTAPSPSAPPAVGPPVSAGAPGVSVLEVERSCRMPVLALFMAAAVWLGFGAVLAVMGAIKAHAPGFLASPALLTYGRVYPASYTALVYGFVFQAGLGVGLWMLCRLGRNPLQGPWMITGAGLFWNLGLIIGVGGVLAGGSTGYPWLEMPALATPILFCSYLLIAAWALVTLHVRTQRTLYVSQWFLLTGLLWFPWVYSTAQVLLVYFPVRGVMQAIVNGWFVHNLFELCLAPFGLAAIFYFLPKLLGRPLHSRGLALFGFWLLVLVGGWGGLRRGDPVPNWLSSVSVVTLVFLLLPMLAFGLSWYRTMAASPKPIGSDWILRFIWVGLVSYALAAVLAAVGNLPEIRRITGFTLYTQGLTQLRIHGFLGMALAGAMYYVVPRLVGSAWPSAALIKVHFWSVAAGLVLSVAALLVGGLVQGMGIEQPQTDFISIVRRIVPFLGTNTLGMTLLLIGYAAFLINLGRLLSVLCPCGALWARFRPAQSGAGAGRRAMP